MELKSINPANEKLIGKFKFFSKEKVFRTQRRLERPYGGVKESGLGGSI